MDRILQAFSQKFHKDNPELFKTSESVYLLRYSLMILQTDLHNPQVKEKMKLGDFFKMTKGINDGGDFSSDYLRTVYNSINEQPLAIHQLDKRRENEKKELLFLEETKSMLKQGQQQLFQLKTATNPRNFNNKNLLINNIHSPATLKLLLEMMWSPLLAAFSVVFEGQNPGEIEENEEKFQETCINGMDSMIKLTAVCGLGDIRDTFLVTFIKFTNILANMHAIKRKNLECIKKILSLSVTHASFLGNGWKYVVDFLSFLDKALQRKENALLLELDPFFLDKVLGNSNGFPGETLLQVIDFLACRSKEELLDVENPQMFCLWKIIEIADGNMDRVRVIWTRIWKKLTEFFSEIGCHRNKNVGFYVVDSIKRLSMKFLQVFSFV